MPYKPGGGNRPELYDPKNGQYTDDINNEIFKKQSHEIELTNIAGRIIFKNYHPEETMFEPRYPIYGFHNNLYCTLYVVDQVRGKEISLDMRKIDNYLLIKKDENDKSNFFEIHGYNIKNSQKLYDEIIKGTDSKKAKFQKINEFGLFVEIPTKIYSITKERCLNITTIWRFDEDTQKLNFITVSLKNKGGI